MTGELNYSIRDMLFKGIEIDEVHRLTEQQFWVSQTAPTINMMWVWSLCEDLYLHPNFFGVPLLISFFLSPFHSCTRTKPFA